ncbi:MAG TPA: aminomethyltransferase beta-barrel domain-containing protein, partial [Micromonosporaceae bacterium]
SRAYVQMRAHGEVTPASITVTPDGEVTAELDSPVRGIAPGQALVAYRQSEDGDIVIGSATITEALSPVTAA